MDKLYLCNICKRPLEFVKKETYIFPEGVCKENHTTNVEIEIYHCSNCEMFYYKKINCIDKENFFKSYQTKFKHFSVNKSLLKSDIKFLKENISKLDSVLDIGGFNLEFLNHLNKYFDLKNAILCDPSTNEKDKGIFKIVKDFYRKELFYEKFDLIVLRNVLQIVDFSILNQIAYNLNDNGFLFVTVSNIEKIKDELFFNSVEREVEFSLNSLILLLQKFNFKIVNFYKDDYISILAKKNIYVKDFIYKNEILKKEIIQKLKNKNVIIWGAGRRVSLIVKMFKENNINIVAIVDKDKNKHNLNVCGTNLKVKPIEYLQNIDKNSVIFINSYAKEEIKKEAKSLNFKEII